MAKRKPTSELNDRNWDEEEEPEEAGTFRLADQNVLKGRTIRKARRTLNADSGSGTTSGGLFAGFALKTKDSSITKPPMSTGVTVNFGSSLTFQSKANGTAQEQLSISTPAENPEFLRHLKLLNENILSWIQKHVTQNPYCILTPSFRDYEKHLGDLERKFTVLDKADSIRESKESSSAAHFGLATTVSAAAASSSLSSASSSGHAAQDSLSVGASKVSTVSSSSSVEPSQTSDAADSTEKKGIGITSFSFGTGARSSGFGNTEAKPFTFSTGFVQGKVNTESKPFSFGVGVEQRKSDTESKPFTFATTIAQGQKASTGTADGDDEEYVPPKAEVREIKEEGSVYSKRCKVFYQKNGQWVDRGVGNIHLKQIEKGHTQLIIRADTNLGNILLNIMLTKAIPTRRQGKNNVFLVCVPNPPLSAKEPDSQTPVPMLMRVKTAEDADELLAKLEEMKA